MNAGKGESFEVNVFGPVSIAAKELVQLYPTLLGTTC